MSESPNLPDRQFGPRSVRRDIDDEIAFHLEMREQEYRDRGMDDRTAREAAERRFGDVKTVRALCCAIGKRWEREKRRASMWADLRQDLRYAARSLGRTPGFTMVAVLTLAVGIAAATAMFSVVDAVLLRPLPYRDANRLVFLWTTRPDLPRENLTPARFLDFRNRSRAFNGIAGIGHVPLDLQSGDLPERVNGVSVSTDFFDILGVRASIGRTFRPEDNGAAVVVLSHAFWVRRYGSDRSVVGRTATFNGTPHLIAGVLPRDFVWPSVISDGVTAQNLEVFVAPAERQVPAVPAGLSPNLASDRESGYMRAVARLRPGVTLEQAQAEIDGLAATLSREYPTTDGGRGAVLVPMRTQFFGDIQRPLAALGAAIALVVLIVCANLASLLLGRASTRQHELAVRAALGASRGRIVRQLLTEALALALLASAIGVGLATPATRWLIASSPGGIIRLDGAHVNWASLLFAVVLAFVTALAFGAAPALHATRRRAEAGLRESGRTTSGGRRLREVVVGAEIAMSVVLLVGAGLLVRSFISLSHVDLGIEVPRLLTFGVSTSGPHAASVQSRALFYRQMLDELRSVPGVRAAAAAVTLPVGGDSFGTSIAVEGQPAVKAREQRVGFQIVSPGYFDTMGIRMRRGRDFNDADTSAGARVAIVSKRFANRFWPNLDPIGRRMRFGSDSSDPWITVVGVASDVRHEGPQAQWRAEVYRPLDQSAMSFTMVVVRTLGKPEAVLADVRRAVARVDPTLPLAHVETMEQYVDETVGPMRFMSTLVSLFGTLAVLLAAVGLYASLAYAVSQRRREIGIRMALGAARPAVVKMLLGHSLRIVAGGVVAGLAIAVLTARAIASLLFGVSPLDPATFAIVPAAFALAALAATIVPLIRALRVNPVEALRTD